MKIRDKYGYPVEIVKGKYVKNFLRCLFIGNLRQTLKRRNQIIQVENDDCTNSVYTDHPTEKGGVE